MAGRPSKFNEKLASKILSLYASGESISKVVSAPSMPSRMSVYRWRKNNREFDSNYLLALECHVEALVDKGLFIVMNAEPKAAKLAQVQANYLTWLAGKLNRGKYGDKIDIDITKILDITPALADAIKRMASIPGNGQKVLNVPCEIIE